MRKYLLLPLLLALVISCNKDDVITQENENPLIELDSETGVYVVKVGKEVKVNPTIQMLTLRFIHGSITVGLFRIALH